MFSMADLLELPTICKAYVRAMQGNIPPKHGLIWYSTSTSILGSWRSPIEFWRYPAGAWQVCFFNTVRSALGGGRKDAIRVRAEASGSWGASGS